MCTSSWKNIALPDDNKKTPFRNQLSYSFRVLLVTNRTICSLFQHYSRFAWNKFCFLSVLTFWQKKVIQCLWFYSNYLLFQTQILRKKKYLCDHGTKWDRFVFDWVWPVSVHGHHGCTAVEKQKHTVALGIKTGHFCWQNEKPVQTPVFMLDLLQGSQFALAWPAQGNIDFCWITMRNLKIMCQLQRFPVLVLKMLWVCWLYKCTLKDWNGNPCSQKYLIQKCLVVIIEKQVLSSSFKYFLYQSERIHDSMGITAVIAFLRVFVNTARVETKALPHYQNKTINSLLFLLWFNVSGSSNTPRQILF